MKKILYLSFLMLFIACKNESADPESNQNSENSIEDTSIVNKISKKFSGKPIVLSLEQANQLAELPLKCVEIEYPTKLGQTLISDKGLQAPKELHPAFYGCFDWHSSVHADWSLVSLLKQFPKLKQADSIKSYLQHRLTKENIQQELAYFQKKSNKTYERTYGWAWLLKLSEELHTWDDSIAKPLEKNLQPLTDQIVKNFKTFLPKLNYPIRTGMHENTAFALCFAYDYAKSVEDQQLIDLTATKAKNFYLNDDDCPLTWEPSGFDFLSPCLEEVDIMQRVLSEQAFKLWIKDFMPQLKNKDFTMEVAEVSDRTDGHLVHLDGLNYSRAWVFYDLANRYSDFSHLKDLGDKHVAYSFPNLVGDSYEGGHWLGTFAIYALNNREK